MTGPVRRHSAATVLVLLTTLAGTSCGRSDREPSAAPPGVASSSTAPDPSDSGPAGEPPVVGPADAVRTVVVSDEATSATSAAAAWPELLARLLEDDGIPMDLATTAPDGAGFTSSPAFADLVTGAAEGSTQLVVLFDGLPPRTDRPSGAAEDAFTEVERAAPDALLVVVGPLSPQDGTATRWSAELAAATRGAGGTYVDPRTEGWSPDATQPEIAELLRPHLQPLVEVLAASGANR